MIPVLIRDDVDTVASLEQAIVENLHREDLNPLEEAAAYQQLIDDFALTQEQVAQRVSRSRAVIANTLRLLRLSDPAKEALATNRISAGHGRALLTIPDPVKQEELLSRILSKNLTVRQAEDAAKEITDPVPSPTPGTTTAPGRAKPHLVSVPDPSVVELENLLEAHLETRVTVDLKGKTGKVVIDFADIADLERIYNRMMGK
jgi:ParB family chromosome partitioning protein